MTKTVLVTGASGFIGRAVLPTLVNFGFRVIATARNIPEHSETPGVVWRQLNVLDVVETERLIHEEQPTDLIHLAWYAEPGKYWHDPINLAWLHASLNLFDNFASAAGKRAVFAGTCAEYDWTLSDRPLEEDSSEIGPDSLYGSCKDSLRYALQSIAGHFDIEVAWARIFFQYGPAEPVERLVPYVIRALIQGQAAECTDGLLTRNFMHVADVGGALVHLLNAEYTGSVNIASRRETTIKELLKLVANNLGKPDLLKLGVKERRPNDVDVLVADTNRLYTELGFRESFTLESGLANAIEWWEFNLEKGIK
jgi:nucleoside-diphosphate-sugar epimerase